MGEEAAAAGDGSILGGEERSHKLRPDERRSREGCVALWSVSPGAGPWHTQAPWTLVDRGRQRLSGPPSLSFAGFWLWKGFFEKCCSPWTMMAKPHPLIQESADALPLFVSSTEEL